MNCPVSAQVFVLAMTSGNCRKVTVVDSPTTVTANAENSTTEVMAEETGTPRVRPRRTSTRVAVYGTKWALRRQEVGAAAGLVMLCVVFGALSGAFLSWSQFQNDSLVTAQYAIIATGVTLLMIAGEFDLTVGVVFAACPMAMAYLYVDHHWNAVLALIVALLGACLMGSINGVLVTRMRLPSFIVTLGMMFFWLGILVALTNGYPIALPLFAKEPLLLTIMGGQVGSWPLYAPVLWAVVIVAVGAYILELTPWGNWIFATGSNVIAARNLGVPVRAVKFVGFVLSALLAGLAGCLILAFQSSASPTQGGNLELEAIVAAVVGGTALTGGVGSVLGSVVGAAIIAVAGSGLVLVGAPSEWYTAIVGLILIVSVLVNMEISGAKGKSLLGLRGWS